MKEKPFNQEYVSKLLTGSVRLYIFKALVKCDCCALTCSCAPLRTAKSLLLCADPLRPVQHRGHPAGHSC